MFQDIAATGFSGENPICFWLRQKPGADLKTRLWGLNFRPDKGLIFKLENHEGTYVFGGFVMDLDIPASQGLCFLSGVDMGICPGWIQASSAGLVGFCGGFGKIAKAQAPLS